MLCVDVLTRFWAHYPHVGNPESGVVDILTKGGKGRKKEVFEVLIFPLLGRQAKRLLHSWFH